MRNNVDVPAWQALGFEKRIMEATAASRLATLDIWWVNPPESPEDVECWASSAITDGMDVFAMGSMGYPKLAPPLDDWRKVGQRTVAAALHYFFGSWRENFTYFDEKMNRAKSRARLPWVSSYREALAIATALGDWKSTDCLLKWPGPDLSFDEGLDDRTKEDNAYQIWLASRLRGEQERAVAKLRAQIEGSTRRRPKMLMTAADALLAKDADGMSAALAKYLGHYRKNEIEPTPVSLGICADANTLWHLARRRGLGEIPLAEDVALLIARP